MQNPCRKYPVVGSFLMKSTLTEKGLHQRGLAVNILELSPLLKEGLT